MVVNMTHLEAKMAYMMNYTTNYGNVTMSTYATLFDFEGKFDAIRAQRWMQEYWTTSFYYIGAYLIIIFTGKYFMTNRPAFELRKILAIWNFILAGFSIIGTYRTIPETIYILNRNNGFHHSVCFPTYHHNPVWSFWAWIFVISKVPELGDTLFIVLRKQRLIFLHWYHHVTVLIYSWYTYQEYVAPARWYVVLNFTVHSFMYSYYGLTALRYRIPKPIAIVITSLQLVQMVMGVVVNVHAYEAKRNGIDCDVSDGNISSALIMYTSYFLLFAKFFYMAYLSKSSNKIGIAKQKGKVE